MRLASFPLSIVLLGLCMISALWSAKGGVGVTACSIAFAGVCARFGQVTLVDLHGDAAVGVGMSLSPEQQGISDWLAARDKVGSDALAALSISITDSLSIIPCGSIEITETDALFLLSALAQFSQVVIDVGNVTANNFAMSVAMHAQQSLMVTRPCYLSLHNALRVPFRASGLVYVGEPSRALHRGDIEDALGVSTAVHMPFDPAVARALDAGVLHSKIPRVVEKAWKSNIWKQAA
jgi:hypothetical protein